MLKDLDLSVLLDVDFLWVRVAGNLAGAGHFTARVNLQEAIGRVLGGVLGEKAVDKEPCDGRDADHRDDQPEVGPQDAQTSAPVSPCWITGPATPNGPICGPIGICEGIARCDGTTGRGSRIVAV